MAAQKAPRRKAFALKATEGTPLFRRDIQYDFLSHVFQDDRRVFSSGSGDEKHTFRDVYVRALMASPRIAKGLREKMADSPAFATDFAMVSLLANVGRINTTMTFLPEMRTNLRSYHPVPSLQKVDANLQDAPRMRNILKACHLAGEVDALPVTPTELRTKIANGSGPSTNIVNLLFVLSNHCAFIASEHFGRQDVDLLDFFTPVPFSSSSRARAFLWLVYHYYQGALGTPNPFADPDVPTSNSATIPPLGELTPAEQEKENIDTSEELEYGEKMRKFRVDFLAHAAQDAASAAAEEGGSEAKGPGKGKGKGRGKKAHNPTVAALASGSTGPTASPKGKKRAHADLEPKHEDVDVVLSSQSTTVDIPTRPTPRRRIAHTPGLSIQDALTAPQVLVPPVRRIPRYTPDQIAARSGRQRTVFGQALHVLGTMDPLVDSDDEADDAARYSYNVKVRVLHDYFEPNRERKAAPDRVHALAQGSVAGERQIATDAWLPQTSRETYEASGRRDALERQSSAPSTYSERRSSLSERNTRGRPLMDHGQDSSYEYYGSRRGYAPEHTHQDYPVFTYDQPVYARRRPSYTDPST